MKKLILFIATLSFGLIFSQKLKETKPSEKRENKIPTNPYNKADSTKSDDIKRENNNAAFYKNVDSSKASQYRMLNKKPNEQYSELPQTKDSTELNKKEKNK
ncbi:hypothetical protein NG800_002115 [Epilithonimonas ginsengisoli]|uniref:Uncharacterized protein n=1 Tax=Epilithonimonas ginsengisoli TaxID=1245592 RepID=A0ABU4JDE1_9FLAO|nr:MULTISPECIES: hypothetical protein [Chryseobacterium group]MBV6878662.1 hypothetical protein [Epilithonimonas sp. FP105]MDW8547687.1 hypothetical protein [Epilithonimonas ginsengisoli]OAH75277.1 hypothetical protein AXA65_04725 [Chryseobacterium sp. FP211-J200]